MDIKFSIEDAEVSNDAKIQPTVATNNVVFNATAPGKDSKFETISFGILLFVAFLMPIFFLPISGLAIAFSKNFLLSASVFIIAILWLIDRLKSGMFAVPKTLILLFAACIPLMFFVSSLMSSAVQVSLTGVGFETGTFLFMFVLFLLLFFSALIFQSKERVIYLYGIMALSFFMIAFFQLLRLFGEDAVFSFGFFNDAISNLVGKWNDLGIFSGFIVVWSLISLELFSFRKLFKWLVYLMFAISLFFLLIINFNTLWTVVGSFALLIFVYTFSFKNIVERNEIIGTRKISWRSLAVLIIAMLALFGSDSIGITVASRFNIVQIEARPTVMTTLSILKETIIKDPLWGVGPNRFVNQWLLLKPDAVNNSPFWNTDFSFGIGIIPTFAVTAGIAGLLAWLLFLGSFLYIGVKTLFLFVSDKLSHYLVASSFLLSLYLWIFTIIYVPGVVILEFAFLMTGVWIALLTLLGVFQQYRFSFSKNPQKSFVSVIVLIVLILGSITGAYIITEKFTAAVLLQKSSALFAMGESDRAYEMMGRTARLGKNDVYYRALADLNLARLRALLGKSGASIDTIRNEFQSTLGLAIDSARQATAFDETNYLNWVSLARVYESVVPLQIAGAYENAKRAYENALKYNPKSPVLYLNLAQLELSHGNNISARTHISEALALKNNYTEAIFLLSRIEADEGKIADAIASAEIASLISPNDTGLFFHLGLLRYTDKDYIGAVSALERAVVLQSDYSNARYFLGLSYYELKRNTDAIAQFENIVSLNPRNAEANKILANLKARKRPFESGRSTEILEDKTSLPAQEY